MPEQVDELHPIRVAWLTDQLIQHETDSEKWWKHFAGFNYLFSPSDDEEPFPLADGPPPGWERLPMHVEEEPSDGE